MEIIHLSKENISEASRLTSKEFKDDKGDEYPPLWLKASLNPIKYHKTFKKYKIDKLKYFVATENNNVIGVIGYYSYRNVKDTNWLGWFCVGPKYRSKGIGTNLLNFIIKKSKGDGKKYLRIYTSDSPRESKAQNMYDKKGFFITRKVKYLGSKYTTIYRKLEL